MASKTFREVLAWQRAHEFVLAFYVGYYSDEVANDLWAKIEEASTVLNAYCKAVKEAKGVTDE